MIICATAAFSPSKSGVEAVIVVGGLTVSETLGCEFAGDRTVAPSRGATMTTSVIKYIELKARYTDYGPAWTGRLLVAVKK